MVSFCNAHQKAAAGLVSVRFDFDWQEIPETDERAFHYGLARNGLAMPEPDPKTVECAWARISHVRDVPWRTASGMPPMASCFRRDKLPMVLTWIFNAIPGSPRGDSFSRGKALAKVFNRDCHKESRRKLSN